MGAACRAREAPQQDLSVCLGFAGMQGPRQARIGQCFCSWQLRPPRPRRLRLPAGTPPSQPGRRGGLFLFSAA
eukprot:8602040-Pyramimonas_sp.AAC.1